MLKLPQVLTWLSYLPYPLRVKIHYIISNCLWSLSVRVSSNFNILTQLVMGVQYIHLPSFHYFRSLLRERKLPISDLQVV